ncbi:hypothetical protein A2U01_0116135, partial [Trifolium medium]|nr:hypothetical protein [Trifolium medium]
HRSACKYNPTLRWIDCYSTTVRWPLTSSDHQVRSVAPSVGN